MKAKICQGCGKKLTISNFSIQREKYRNSVCKKCHWIRQKGYNGRSMDEMDKIHSQVLLQRSPVKIFTRKEIAAVEHLYR